MNQRSAQMKKQMFNQFAKQQQELAAKQKELDAKQQELAAKQQQELAAKQQQEEIKRIRNKLAQDERLQMEYNLMRHKLQQKGK